MPRQKKEVKEEVIVLEVNKKDALIKLISEKAYKLFDQEPRGSLQNSVLSQLADEILEL